MKGLVGYKKMAAIIVRKLPASERLIYPVSVSKTLSAMPTDETSRMFNRLTERTSVRRNGCTIEIHLPGT
jgi:hypothetical protein